MKIAVMTWFHYDNYGTVLQAAALVRTLKGYGHQVDVIDYFPGSRCLVLPEGSRRRRMVRTWQKNRKNRRDPVITTQISGEKFDRYRSSELTLTHYCATLADLEALNDEYDAFVCGSDRIWLPMYFDPHFYLDFVKDPERMIAYAPSILDTGDIDPFIRKKMEQLIGRFRHMSVREENGRKYLDEAFGEKTMELADPTLLVDASDWGSMVQLPGEEQDHYLLACFQGENKTYFDAALKLAQRLNLSVRIIPIHASDLYRIGAIEGEIGPVDYISEIRNADYVCTDSYHAIVLSLVFQKQVCCFERYTQREKLVLNARVRHILDSVGLADRLYDTDASLERYLGQIDYIPVNYKLDALRIKSREFLQNALEQVEEHVRSAVPGRRHVLEGYSLCSGCGACMAVCPRQAVSVERNAKGFYEARIDEGKCEHCELCRNVCPFQGEEEGVTVAEGVLRSYCDEDNEVRETASAGGLCARLAELALAQGRAVGGCIFEEASQRGVHILVTPQDDPALLGGMRGSKYMQSDFSAFLKQAAAYEGPMTIFAAPCQIAGARRVLYKRDNIRYVEITCSGVPSYHVFEKYRDSFRKGRNRLNTENFELAVRYRQLPSQGSFIRVTDGTNERIITSRKDLFSRIMQSREAFCETCYDCRWRNRSDADLRIGDFVKDSYSQAETPTSSSVIILTENGKKMLDELMIEGYWEGLHKEDLVSYLTEHPEGNPPRPVFYEELMEKLADEKTSLGKIVNEYVKPLE